MPFWIKVDGMMSIVAIYLDTASKGDSSSWNGKSIISTCKGNIIVDMPCPLVDCHTFFLSESICACSAKIVNNCQPLGFRRQLFLISRPWHHQKTKQQQNCQSEQDSDQVLSSSMDGWHCQNKQHGDTVPKKNARHVLTYSSDQYKKARQVRFNTAGYVWTTWGNWNFHPYVDMIASDNHWPIPHKGMVKNDVKMISSRLLWKIRMNSYPPC